MPSTPLKPSCLQTTLASAQSQSASHTLPHWPSKSTSTLPSLGVSPFASRTGSMSGFVFFGLTFGFRLNADSESAASAGVGLAWPPPSGATGCGLGSEWDDFGPAAARPLADPATPGLEGGGWEAAASPMQSTRGAAQRMPSTVGCWVTWWRPRPRIWTFESPSLRTIATNLGSCFSRSIWFRIEPPCGSYSGLRSMLIARLRGSSGRPSESCVSSPETRKSSRADSLSAALSSAHSSTVSVRG